MDTDLCQNCPRTRAEHEAQSLSNGLDICTAFVLDRKRTYWAEKEAKRARSMERLLEDLKAGRVVRRPPLPCDAPAELAPEAPQALLGRLAAKMGLEAPR